MAILGANAIFGSRNRTPTVSARTSETHTFPRAHFQRLFAKVAESMATQAAYSGTIHIPDTAHIATMMRWSETPVLRRDDPQGADMVATYRRAATATADQLRTKYGSALAVAAVPRAPAWIEAAWGDRSTQPSERWYLTPMPRAIPTLWQQVIAASIERGIVGACKIPDPAWAMHSHSTFSMMFNQRARMVLFAPRAAHANVQKMLEQIHHRHDVAAFRHEPGGVYFAHPVVGVPWAFSTPSLPDGASFHEAIAHCCADALSARLAERLPTIDAAVHTLRPAANTAAIRALFETQVAAASDTISTRVLVLLRARYDLDLNATPPP